uniref:Ribosomal protein S8 n=1 Tax=Cryptomonas curvata TaxID=233186 RepID=A0A2P1G8F6_9CRYP|nr:ribosomal protein S8 [Cryptomonas curvata]AVM81245.1 ribosomal protein S8 [Cryptomonas curvata]
MNNKYFLNLSNSLKASKYNKPAIIKIRYSKKSLDVLSILLKEGYIRGYFIDNCTVTKYICILVKYIDDHNLLNIKTLNLNKQRTYLSVTKLKTHFTAFDLLILSTKKGIMSHLNAINLNIGGFPIINII